MAQSDAQSSDQERFLSAVYLGSDLLGKGDLEGARTALREALSVRPDDAKARNLLGLASFKLGHFDEAEELYAKLVHENPTDATLRVNLGLVYLKAGRFEDAIRELSAAADLEPGHKRAQNYLGLAHARVGDYAQARECFAAAGSTAMVEQMDDALAGNADPAGVDDDGADDGHIFDAEVDVDGEEDEGEELVAEVDLAAAESAPAPTAAPEGLAPVPAAVAEEPVAEEPVAEEPVAEEPVAEEPAAEEPAAEEPAAEEPAAEEPAAEEPAAEASVPVAHSEDGPRSAARAIFGLEAPSPSPRVPSGISQVSAPAANLRLGRDEPRLPGSSARDFQVGEGVLVIPVHGEVLSRCSGLLTTAGNLEFEAEVKRFRGRATEKPFGEGADRFFRVKGEGQLLIGLGETVATCFTIEDIDGYFEESRVLAFEEAVAYENGRVPSSVSPDLNLVHLRGRGQVAVRSEGPIRAMDVASGAPLRVPLAHLVGWHGGLTPRIAVLAEEGGPGGEPLVGIELIGEGVALLSLPAHGRG